MNLQSHSLEELQALLAKVQAEILKHTDVAAATLGLSGKLTLERSSVPRKALSPALPDPGPRLRSHRVDAPPASAPVLPLSPAAPLAEGVAKYRHPTHRDLSWDGEGAMPEWVGVWLSSGRSLDALAVAAEKRAPRVLPPSFLLPPGTAEPPPAALPPGTPATDAPPAAAKEGGPSALAPAHTSGSNSGGGGGGGGHYGHYARRRRHLRVKDH